MLLDWSSAFASWRPAQMPLGRWVLCLYVCKYHIKPCTIAERNQTSNWETRVVESNVAIIVSSLPGFAKFVKTHVSKAASTDSRRHDGPRLGSGGIPCQRMPIGSGRGTFELSSRVNLRDAMDL